MFPSDSSDELYRLRWDSSKQVVDLSNSFQAFRNDEELLDVSLVCSSGKVGGSTLKAHKVVLAAYSPVFKQMFNRLSDPRSPIVFLKGISFDNLSYMLDFMYQGSVDVPKSKINEFFADAQELQIRGLRGDNNNESSKEERRDRKPIVKSFQSSKMSDMIRTKKRLKMEEEEPEQREEDIFEYKSQSDEMTGSSLKRARRAPTKTNLKTEIDDDQSQTYASEFSLNDDPLDRHNQSQDKRPSSIGISSYSAEDRARIEAMFEKTDKWSGSESKKRCLYACKLCSKELRSDRRVQHLRTTHPN